MRQSGTVEALPGEGLVLFADGIAEVERNYFQGLPDLKAAIVAE